MVITLLDVGGYKTLYGKHHGHRRADDTQQVFLWKIFADSESFLHIADLLTYTGPGLTETTVVFLGTCKRPVGSKDPVHSRHTRTMGPPT